MFVVFWLISLVASLAAATGLITGVVLLLKRGSPLGEERTCNQVAMLAALSTDLSSEPSIGGWHSRLSASR
jgi:hypothetical protein